MFRMQTDVSIKVDDIDDAAHYYTAILGFQEVGRTGDWVEVHNGPIRFFLCNDDGPSPMFLLMVDDVQSAVDHVVRSGGKVMAENGDETFIQDRYGVYYCISPESGPSES